jgi:hypothetical protein
MSQSFILKTVACIISLTSLLFAVLLSWLSYKASGREGLIGVFHILFIIGSPCTLLVFALDYFITFKDQLIFELSATFVLFVLQYNLLALGIWKLGNLKRINGYTITMENSKI